MGKPFTWEEVLAVVKKNRRTTEAQEDMESK